MTTCRLHTVSELICSVSLQLWKYNWLKTNLLVLLSYCISEVIQRLLWFNLHCGDSSVNQVVFYYLIGWLKCFSMINLLITFILHMRSPHKYKLIYPSVAFKEQTDKMSNPWSNKRFKSMTSPLRLPPEQLHAHRCRLFRAKPNRYRCRLYERKCNRYRYRLIIIKSYRYRYLTDTDTDC